jgi:hypothetical protein
MEADLDGGDIGLDPHDLAGGHQRVQARRACHRTKRRYTANSPPTIPDNPRQCPAPVTPPTRTTPDK